MILAKDSAALHMNTTENPKRILIFGDSYTFGKIPGGLRYPNTKRFTGVLQQELGESYEVIEEGLRGRMLVGENAFFPYRNGAEQFGPIIGSHLPFDLLIIFLGTNDANSGSQKSPEEIVSGLDSYQEKLKWWCEHLNFPMPKILIMAPPPIKEEDSYKAFQNIFKGSEEKIRELPGFFKSYAEKNGLYFLDTSSLIAASEIDGIHLSERDNHVLGLQLAEHIKTLF